MRSIITGGAGFIGSNLAKVLKQKGHEVIVLDILADSCHGNRRVKGVEYCTFNIVHEESNWGLFTGADVVFHLAANSSVEFSLQYPGKSMMTNVVGTTRVLMASQKYGVQRIIFAGSCATYGDSEQLPFIETEVLDPKSPYALQKQTGEQLFRLWNKVYGVSSVVLRIFNVYGPLMDPKGDYALVIGKFLDQKSKGLPLTITGDGNQTRDFTHVTDVVRAMVIASESDQVGSGEVINIGSGRETSINELATIFGGPIVYIPPRIEPRRALANIQKAKQLLAWEPLMDIRTGITQLFTSNA